MTESKTDTAVTKLVQDVRDLLGEGFHTAFRKADYRGDPAVSKIWHLIDEMSSEAWDDVLSFVMNGVEPVLRKAVSHARQGHRETLAYALAWPDKDLSDLTWPALLDEVRQLKERYREANDEELASTLDEAPGGPVKVWARDIRLFALGSEVAAVSSGEITFTPVETWYLATCQVCTPFLPQPFSDREQRASWACRHVLATGHEITYTEETRPVSGKSTETAKTDTTVKLTQTRKLEVAGSQVPAGILRLLTDDLPGDAVVRVHHLADQRDGDQLIFEVDLP